ncbi:ATP-binding protein, partial [Clostridium perfringens]
MIFERFKQVNKSFTREQEGSGIGLSLVKALVELHN